MQNIFNRSAKTSSAVLPAADTSISNYKAEVLRLMNSERKNNSAAELKALAALDAIADIRARESAVSFLHTRSDGTWCFTVFAEHALKYRAAGENLAYGYKTPKAAVSAWMKSEGHRKNILDTDFEYAGIGYYLSDKGTIYCASLFYTPTSGK
jgi:uncharacterized protein YkwD